MSQPGMAEPGQARREPGDEGCSGAPGNQGPGSSFLLFRLRASPGLSLSPALPSWKFDLYDLYRLPSPVGNGRESPPFVVTYRTRRPFFGAVPAKLCRGSRQGPCLGAGDGRQFFARSDLDHAVENVCRCIDGPVVVDGEVVESDVIEKDGGFRRGRSPCSGMVSRRSSRRIGNEDRPIVDLDPVGQPALDCRDRCGPGVHCRSQGVATVRVPIISPDQGPA